MLLSYPCIIMMVIIRHIYLQDAILHSKLIKEVDNVIFGSWFAGNSGQDWNSKMVLSWTTHSIVSNEYVMRHLYSAYLFNYLTVLLLREALSCCFFTKWLEWNLASSCIIIVNLQGRPLIRMLQTVSLVHIAGSSETGQKLVLY